MDGPFPHPILCPTYAAEMLVITKCLLLFVSSEEDSSCRFRRPTKASPDRKSKLRPCLLPILLSSSFYFFPLPSFLLDDLAPLDRRTRTDDRESELAISRASQPTFLLARHKGHYLYDICKILGVCNPPRKPFQNASSLHLP